MSSIVVPKVIAERDYTPPPDDTQLPETDGSIVENFQEHPQSILLTDAIWPVLQQRHADGQFCVGQSSGIYWRETEPPLEGCKAPDWFYVPGVTQMREGRVRRSYVLWREGVAPLLLLEFVSGDGTEERDRTPWKGKFWVYEQGIRAPFYGIYEVDPGRVELYHLVDGRYAQLPANDRGHFEIADLGVELGIWQGTYRNQELPWLRFWDAAGYLLPTNNERAEQEKQRAEQEKQRAEQEKQRAEQEKQRAEREKQRAEQEKQRAEQEKQRADSAEKRAERLAERLRALGQNPDEI